MSVDFGDINDFEVPRIVGEACWQIGEKLEKNTDSMFCKYLSLFRIIASCLCHLLCFVTYFLTLPYVMNKDEYKTNELQ